MTRRFFGFLGALTGIALVSGSCVEDPLADLDATPAAVILDYGLLVQAIGERDTVTARAVDGRFTPLAIPITYSACDADVAVSRNLAYDPVPATSAQFVVQAVTSGASCVVVSAGGVSETLDIGVLPVAFTGTPSATTLQTGQTLTLAATSELEFDTASANINFGDGYRGFVTNRTATSLSVIVPIPSPSLPGPLTVEGVNVTYVPNLVASLSTQAAFTVSNPHDPNDFPLPATTASFPDTVYEGFAAGEADNLYTFTLAATTTLTMSLDWVGNADLDLYLCNAACSAAVALSAGSSKPEAFTATVPAGTYNIYVNNWVASGATPVSPMYQIRITP